MAAYSGLFNGVHNENYALLHATTINKTAGGNRIQRVLRHSSMRELRELLNTLIGAAAGAEADKDYARVGHTPVPGDPAVHGGARTIDTIEVLDAYMTTATDVTNLKELTTRRSDFATYVEDAANNGIGANQGLL